MVIGLPERFSSTVAPASAAEDDGRVRIEIRGHSLQSLAGEIAGFGAHLEVIEPPELRDELARIGAELLAAYPPRS